LAGHFVLACGWKAFILTQKASIQNSLGEWLGNVVIAHNSVLSLNQFHQKGTHKTNLPKCLRVQAGNVLNISSELALKELQSFESTLIDRSDGHQ